MKLDNQTFTPREKLTLGIAVSALLTGTLIIIGPVKMYASAADELWFALWDVLPVIAIFSLGLFFVLTTLCYLIPVRYGRFFFCLIFSFGIALYIEGTFMPMDYGPLDGVPINWNKYAGRIFYDSIIWLLCIVLPLLLLVLKSNLFKKLVPLVCAALLIMQGTELIIGLPNIVGWKIQSDYLTDEGKFTLGKKQNIIVIILDAFDHRMFKRSIHDSKELARSFKDFNYYENSMSNFNHTTASIPSILTGISYDNSVPFNQYISSAYEQFPLLETLFKKGYDSRLFTVQKLTPMNNKKTKSYIANQNTINHSMRIKITYLLLQYTLMRYAPVYYKGHFWLGYDSFENVKSNNLGLFNFWMPWYFLNEDLSFYKQMKRDGITLMDGNAFRFYHFQGSHPPINMDGNMNMVNDLKYENSAILDQAKGSLKITAEFLQEMKKNGVYENSTVIIAGDHGFLDDPTIGYYSGAVMLIKNKDANYPSMKNSPAPVINSDIAATIMDIIHPDNDFSGIAIHKLDESTPRSRKCYFYDYFTRAKKGYLPDLEEFINNTITIHPENFIMTGNILSSDGIAKRKYNYYQLGSLINTNNIHDWRLQVKGGKTYDSVRVVIGGTDLQPNDVFKTAGFSSTLGFILSESGTDLSLTMMLASANGKGDPQRLFIEVNGSRLPEEFVFNGSDFRTVKINIPGKLIKEDKHLTLSLLTPDAKQKINPFQKIIYFKESLVIKSLVIETANH